MTGSAASFEAAVATALEQHLSPLRSKTFADISVLPESTGLGTIHVHGRNVELYLFSQKRRSDLIWIVALGAEKKWFGLFSRHIERGFEASPTSAPRALSSNELLLNGG